MRTRPSILLGRDESDGRFSFRYLTSRPPVKILAGFSIFYLLLIQYYSHANYRDPTSYFFDPTHAYERMYSADRIREADAFIRSAELLTSGPTPSQQPPVMCIGVATVTRRGEQYVRRTIGSLLDGLTHEERHSIYLDILIGHTNRSTHPISGEKWVGTLPNKVLTYEETDFSRIKEWEAGGWYRNKTIFDYTYLLNDCYATGAKYIAMLEDDTLAVEGWYPRALEALRNVEAKMARRIGKKWVFMRLFYAEDLFGWNSENWPTYLFWSFVTWAITSGSLIFARNRSRSLQNFLSNESMLAISGLCIPALVALFFASGRNSIWPLAPGVHEMNKNGCCSQGYIYPREIVAPLLERTDLVTDWLVDMMVEKISDQEGWIRWARAPALLQHIGTTSSKGYGFDNTAGHLWNFGFELYQKSHLGRSHQ
ncbi:related to integral membrane protein [Phialocephala subalpina]|uniref:Related to integral membrane protein n=1 Tax=Phialocephala subalpina TaxID=576137 RepID=A0A1L7WUZ8_9HELO|nr:related to integral membrane protein [Phialocephala subalpina]